MASEEHDRLVSLGARWLKRNGFPVVATELTSLRNREQPDVIGYRASCSVVIEVKVSRADFRADSRKPERSAGGLGNYRFYLCPEGLIEPSELPPRWGLLYAKGKRIQRIHGPDGNFWPSPQHKDKVHGWADFAHESDFPAEQSALFSIARRLAAGEKTYS